jgi:bla regulator protein BlaR1
MIALTSWSKSWLSLLAVGSLQAASMILVLFVIRAIAKHRIPAWVYCVGWMLACVRLLVPLSPTSPFSVFGWLAGSETPWTVAPGKMSDPAPFEWVPTAAQAMGFWFPLALLWLAGAIICLALAVIRDRELRKRVALGRQVTDPDFLSMTEACRRQMKLPAPIPVVEVVGFSSPAVTGLFRPVLVLPPGLLPRLNERQQRALLLHEFAHVRRRDTLVGTLAMISVALHWFNPLAWLAVRALRQDRETACDTLAMSTLLEKERKLYGGTLLGIMELTSPPPQVAATAAFVFEHSSGLEQRFRAIFHYRGRARWASIASLSVILALAGTTMTEAAPPNAKRAIKYTVPNDGKTYLLAEFELNHGGKTLATPKLITAVGSPASITSGTTGVDAWKLTIDFVPTAADETAVTATMKIKLEQGNQTKESETSFIVGWDEPGYFKTTLDGYPFVITFTPKHP